MLEGHDKIHKNDWVRAVDFDGDPNIYSFYSGRPDNNTRWLRVKDIFGPHVNGKTVDELHESFEKMVHYGNQLLTFEFIRGHLPEENLWNKPLNRPE